MPAIPLGKKGLKYLFLVFLALLLPQTAGLFLFFTVPLCLIYREWGLKGFLPAAVLSAAGAVIRALLDGRNFQGWMESQGPADPGAYGIFLLMQMGLPLVVLGGVFLLLAGDLVKIPGVFRLLAALGIMGIYGAFLLPRFFENEIFAGRMREILVFMGQNFSGTGEIQGGMNDALMEGFFSDPRTFDIIKDTVLKTFLPVFELLILFLWRLAELIDARLRGAGPGLTLRNFRTPQALLWPVIFCWLLNLVDLIFPLGRLAWVFWNAGLALLVIYGIQGLGVAQSFLDRWKIRRGLQVLLLFVFLSLLARPVAGLVLMIAVPVLGISENWVKYRE